MSRFINPTPQICDANGDPLAFGLVYFYESETNIPKTVYADELETIPAQTGATGAIELDAAGRMPNCFYSGSARVVVKSADNQQIWERDPVGGENVFADFGEWQNFIRYDANNIVELNGQFYISQTNGNQGNDPSVGPGSNANWVNINFLPLWNSTVSYSIGATVKTSDGNVWASQTASNLGNNPSTDGGTNWLPAVDGSKIPEIIAIEARTTTVIELSGGGTLTAYRVNEVQDSSTYTLPLANTVSAGQWLDVSKTDENRAETPTVQRAGTDTISWSGGTDTDFLFNNGTLSYRRFVSDGVSDWRIQ